MKSFRQNKLLDILQKDKIIKTKAMADYFGVSIETIRRDLDQLESEGIINKKGGRSSCPCLTFLRKTPTSSA